MKFNYFIMLLLTAIAINSCEFGCSGIVAKAKKLTIKGIVIGKYKMSTGCFGAIVVSQENRFDTIENICYCVPERKKVYEYTLPGDSIYKQAGSLDLTIIRRDSIRKFDYPLCIE